MQTKFSLTGYMYNLIVVKIDIWDYLMGTFWPQSTCILLFCEINSEINCKKLWTSSKTFYVQRKKAETALEQNPWLFTAIF